MWRMVTLICLVLSVHGVGTKHLDVDEKCVYEVRRRQWNCDECPQYRMDYLTHSLPLCRLIVGRIVLHAN
jgi:hypothetical protein